MSNWNKVKETALIASRRHCCLCHKFKGLKIEVHHIINRSEGGKDEFDNAIPLCFDCHGDMRSYDNKHPKGAKYSRSELKQRRDDFYAFLEKNPTWSNLEQNTIESSTHRLNSHDNELFNAIKNMDKSGGIINYLRNESFYSGLTEERVDQIHDFEYHIGLSPVYFSDNELNFILQKLIKKMGLTSRAIANKTFRARDNSRRYEVPKEQGEEQFYNDIEIIRSNIDSALAIYDSLIRLGISKAG